MKRLLVTIFAGMVVLCWTLSAAEFDPFKETPAEYNARAQWLRDAQPCR